MVVDINQAERGRRLVMLKNDFALRGESPKLYSLVERRSGASSAYPLLPASPIDP